MIKKSAEVAVVGAGILGLAHAYALARRGHSVVVYERGPRAEGASIRNFGMIWPIGQPAGRTHQMALRSRDLWVELLNDARLPYLATGSLHAVYRADEAAVAREFCEVAPGLGYLCEWLDAEAALARSNALRPEGLLGAIWSATEITVDPRMILASMPAYLTERFGVQFRWGTAVHSVESLGVDTAII